MTTTPPDHSAWREQTRLVRGGVLRSEFRETSEALYLNSGYVYDSAEEAEASFSGDLERFVYSRYNNPTLSMLEERLRLAEGAEVCRTTASGMAAVFAALACQVKAGDRVVAARALFGSCLYIIQEILPNWGVEIELVDGTDLDAWSKALSRPTRAVFLETPANPTLDLVDVKAVCELSHKAGARVIVDNVFATPLLQKPMELGADIVVYSTTKHIDGQGRCLGGAVLGRADFINDELTPFLRHTGPCLSPFNAWVMLKGLETLSLRIERHCDNAERVAAFLQQHPAVTKAVYPTLDNHPQHELARQQMRRGGSVVAFELASKDAAFAMLNKLGIIDISNNLGDAKSLICHPHTTTHQRVDADLKAELGITHGLLRLSVGLEDADDLIEDLDQALRAASA